MTRDRLILALRAKSAAEGESLLREARARGYRSFVTEPGNPGPSTEPSEEIFGLSADAISLHDSREKPPAHIFEVGNAAQLDRVLRSVRPGETPLVIRWTADRVIPLETVVARRLSLPPVWIYANKLSDIPSALGALERGADRVIVELSDLEQLDRLEGWLDLPVALPSGLKFVRVRRVEPAGLGDRIIVDSTSLLSADEGLLVGSSAAFLFHVVSEAVGSEHSRPRPFRVNAGAAHSYVLRPDGSTRYLSEISSGDTLLAVRATGELRTVRVGRVKIERRPLVIIETSIDGRLRTIFLQEAETVRLTTREGAIATTELKESNEVLGAPLPPARHLGAAIEESVDER